MEVIAETIPASGLKPDFTKGREKWMKNHEKKNQNVLAEEKNGMWKKKYIYEEKYEN